MLTLNPYLYFNGNTEEAFEFYKSIFGGEYMAFQRFADMPGSEKYTEEDRQKVMHVTLPLSDGHMLMASDLLESAGQTYNPGTNVELSLKCTTKEETERIYHALLPGGTTRMELADTFWGSYFGMLVDKYGIRWIVSFDYK